MNPITDKNNLPYGGLDTETTYSNEYSVSTLGNQGYVNDPRFDCYLISIDFPDWSWVGHPKDCPWEKLRGRSFVSANAGFDQAVLRRMIELGQAPAWVYPEDWVCSANLSVYCGYPRALGQCVEQLFGRVVDKTIRNVDMKGHNLDSMSPELREKVLCYAAADARDCRLVWEELADLWPLAERRVSELTYAMGAKGMHADRAGVENDIAMLKGANAAAFKKIPWTQTIPASVPLSPKALRAYCAEQGIEPPSSLAQTSEECAAWEEKYGGQFPIVGAMRDYRRTNALLKKYEVISTRLNAEDRMPYSLKYFGASTGRWSGESGFNVQNLPKEPMYFASDWSITRNKTDRFVEMRSKFTAAPGKKLIIADYAQIEARVGPWLARDKETIDLVRSGLSVYDVHALQSGMWDGKGGSLKKVNKTLYALAKARVLGLGFGCGWWKFVTFARQSLKYEVGVFDQVFGAPVSADNRAAFIDYVTKYDKKGQTLPAFQKMEEREQNEWVNSWLQVTDFRNKNPKIVALWKQLDTGLKGSVGGTYEVGLPSGRILRYFNVTSRDGEIMVRTTKGGHFSHAYGGLLTENCLAGDTLVCSNLRGWVRLDTLTKNELVWDGERYVAHSGVVAKGEQETLLCHGVAATADHLFLTLDGWVRAEIACLRGLGYFIQSNDEKNNHTETLETRQLYRENCGLLYGNSAGRNNERENNLGSDVLLRENVSNTLDQATWETSPKRMQPSMPELCAGDGAGTYLPRDEQACDVRGMVVDESTLPEGLPPSVQKLRGSRNNGMSRVGGELPGLPTRHGADVETGARLRPHRQLTGVFKRELPLDDADRELPEQEGLVRTGMGARHGEAQRDPQIDAVLSDTPGSPSGTGVLRPTGQRTAVYDIINCGPNRRFAVRGATNGPTLIAHNCVQATARDILAEAMVRLADAGIHVIASIHDEVVCEVDPSVTMDTVVSLMTQPPAWAKTLPLGAEAEESMFYKK